MLKGSVRIIGGKWRHRLVRFSQSASIKPTPNRVRETVFNWLSPIIQSTYCLDVFAGSGALGLEALSRGAAWVGFIERSYVAAHGISQQLNIFNAMDQAYVYHQPYQKLTLSQLMPPIPRKTIDIVFLDPPFRKGMLKASVDWLTVQSFISEKTHLYIEYENELSLDSLPMAGWYPVKQQHAGQLHYGLWKKST